MLKKIESDLDTIDVAPPQIMIEVLAVEFQNTRDAERSLGITFTNASNAATYDAGLGNISYSTIGLLPADFLTSLRWLESKGKAIIKAQPRMAVLNGHWGRIFIGTTRFIEVEVTQYGTATKRIQGVNVGVTLGVLPWTGSGGEITTTISPKVSSIAELDPKTGLPVLSTRDANTQVRTKDGETIVIGGLTLEQEQVVNQKTPILGDIPLLGKLFRRRVTQRTTSELVIFVTPRLLDDSGRLPDAAEEQDVRERFLEAGSKWQEPRTIRISPEDLRAGRWQRAETK
jgi:type II secretory pathway component GspD/PulD (secretin)